MQQDKEVLTVAMSRLTMGQIQADRKNRGK